jgi:hypothetical protein
MGQAQSIQPQSQGTPYGQPQRLSASGGFASARPQQPAQGPQSGGGYSAWAPQGSQQGGAYSQWSPGGQTRSFGQEQYNQGMTAWTMPKRDLMQWGQSLPQQQYWQPQTNAQTPWGQANTNDINTLNAQRAAMVQQINQAQANQEVGTYLGEGEPPAGWGQMQINPQQMWQNSQQMVQQGWQNPFAVQQPAPPQPQDAIRNLFTQNNIQAPDGFMDQLISLLGGQSPQPQLQPRQPQINAEEQVASGAPQGPQQGRPASRVSEWLSAGMPGYDTKRAYPMVLGYSELDGSQFGNPGQASAYDNWLRRQQPSQPQVGGWPDQVGQGQQPPAAGNWRPAPREVVSRDFTRTGNGGAAIYIPVEWRNEQTGEQITVDASMSPRPGTGWTRDPGGESFADPTPPRQPVFEANARPPAAPPPVNRIPQRQTFSDEAVANRPAPVSRPALPAAYSGKESALQAAKRQQMLHAARQDMSRNSWQFKNMEAADVKAAQDRRLAELAALSPRELERLHASSRFPTPHVPGVTSGKYRRR